MKTFKIKEPKMKSIMLAVQAYNNAEGYGIEIQYDLKKGRVFAADYFQNFIAPRFIKITGFSEGSRPSSITAEDLLREIEEMKKSFSAPNEAAGKSNEDKPDR